MLNGLLRREANAKSGQTRSISVYHGEVWSHDPVQDIVLHIPNASQPGAADDWCWRSGDPQAGEDGLAEDGRVFPNPGEFGDLKNI